MNNRGKDTLIWGIIILAIGLLFLLHNLGLRIRVWHLIGTYWPLVLIGIGAKNIFLVLRRRS